MNTFKRDLFGTDDNERLLDVQSSDLEFKEITERCKFNDTHTTKIKVSRDASVIQISDVVLTGSENKDNNTQATEELQQQKPFPTILKLIVDATQGDFFGSIDDTDQHENSPDQNNKEKDNIPTMLDIVENAKHTHGIDLDEKQMVAYKIICSSFLIQIMKDQASQCTDCNRQQHSALIEETTKALIKNGGKEQLIMFITGPAGAGKTTAVKLAQNFCEEFCNACAIPFDQYSFFFTAYTGAAASDSGGRTTLTSLKIPICGALKDADELTTSILHNVKILIMDEISFMTKQQLNNIDKRLQGIFNCAEPFGGMSVIFSGDFRQMEFGSVSNDQLLYTTHSKMEFENLLNAALILDNKHRFKDDPEFGEMLTDMWFDDLSIEQKEMINERFIADKSQLPKYLEDNCHYACPTNAERNAIAMNNFIKHIESTHR
jgi:hypothetical protein